jgi:hypothetical protein
MKTNPVPTHQKELHAVLQDDTSGTHARELVAVLGRSQRLASSRLRGMQASADFKATEQLVRALEAGEKVIREVWESMHGKRLH